MPSSTSLFGQVARGASLCGPIPRQLVQQPSLLEVATQMLEQQWQYHTLQGPAPSTLYLAWRQAGDPNYRFERLAEALIRRYCTGRTLNLSAGVELLTQQPGSAAPPAVALDMVQIEALLNEAAPFLIDCYKEALGTYWSSPGSNGVLRWQWLADYLKWQLGVACDIQAQAGKLAPLEAATARVLVSFPEAEQRRRMPNLLETQVGLFALDLDAQCRLDPELASALLITRTVAATGRFFALVYTLAGGLYRFDSLQQLAESLARGVPSLGPFDLHLYGTDESVFRAQAALLLEQQLKLVDAVAAAAREMPAPEHWLGRRLDEATSLINISSAQQREKLQQYRALLPDWLGRASNDDARRYFDGLLHLAALQQESGERSFLHGLANILDYSRDALRSAIEAEHGGAALDIDDIEIINHQVIAVGTGSAGSISAAGGIRTVRFSLVQFALENLAALRAGSVQIVSRSDATLPDWLTLDYLKALVVRLDIGEVYPQLLQQQLLDDAPVRAERELLFCTQLQVQLPLLALEKYLRGAGGISRQTVDLLEGLLAPEPRSATVACRPLAFIRSPGASADVALNAYLLASTDAGSPACVLYRPLHREPLLEFASPEAFFEQLCDQQALQDDILQRLDDSVRAVYANGGFDQPHVSRFLQGDEFAPLSTPAPAQLATAVLDGDVAAHFYRDSARELIAQARRLSRSNQESRWVALQELGWLMFNCLLPLLNGPLAVSGWMVQFFSSLRQSLQAPGAADQSLVDLLLNLAFVLFSFKVDNPGTRISAHDHAPAVQAPPARLLASGLEVAVSSPSGTVFGQFDFSWSMPSARLSSERQRALQAMRSPRALDSLGSAIPHGALRGMYLEDNRLWAVVEGVLYEVKLVDETPRIVAADGQLGPWLRLGEDSRWALDLNLRLRGGMPLNRRIERLREQNRQQVRALEQALEDTLPRRLESALQLKEDLAVLGAEGRTPSPASLERYQEHLHARVAVLQSIDDNFQALNQLKAQTDFRRLHGQNLLDFGATQVQLLNTLHRRYNLCREQLMRMRWVAGEDRLVQITKNRTSAEYLQLVERFRQSKTLVDQLIVHHEQALATRRALADVLPQGPEMAAQLDAMLAQEPSLKAWRSSEIGLLTTLIVDASKRAVGSEFLLEAVRTARIGLQMEMELEDASTSFSASERLQVLDSALRNYASALDGIASYRAEGTTAATEALVSQCEQMLGKLRGDAEAALADQIRKAPPLSEPAPVTGHRSRVLIRTRNRGMVVGQRRPGRRGEDVVVFDPIEQQELARYEPSAEEGVWQAVSPTRPAAPRVSLSKLLARAKPLLAEAERQIRRAQAQARTASVPVEMEEILVQQSRPLEQVVEQIEAALSASNSTDAVSSGSDAALVAKSLSEKAGQMQAEGRRLRIALIKAQPPTAARIDFLKAQGEVSISALEKRKPLRRRKGLAQDYLDEYVIQDNAKQPLWYAHFHYASVEADDLAFTAGHLKTLEQRFDAGQLRTSGEADNLKVIEVYRSRIDRAMAARLFLPS